MNPLVSILTDVVTCYRYSLDCRDVTPVFRSGTVDINFWECVYERSQSKQASHDTLIVTKEPSFVSTILLQTSKRVYIQEVKTSDDTNGDVELRARKPEEAFTEHDGHNRKGYLNRTSTEMKILFQPRWKWIKTAKYRTCNA